MKRILILGAGAAGTMMAQHLSRKLDAREWKITVVDGHATHYYQPGFLFMPFGVNTADQIRRPKTDFIPRGVEFLQKRADVIEADSNQVKLVDGETLDYDILIIATGARVVPEETEGLTGDHWYKTAFDFYTFEGSLALRDKLSTWEGGNLVVHVTEMPIKCPVAPLEFAFLADDFFRRRKMRDKVNISYATPLSGAFTKPRASAVLGHLLEEKNIRIVPDFEVESVDGTAGTITSYAGTTLDFDLLVTVPTNMGDPLIERSGLGDDLNFVPVNKFTLQADAKENIFVVGDATNVPASKAGSVAHFEAELLTENIARYIAGEELEESFDGHANCFIESGNRKGFVIDFNYDLEPVEGTFPFPGLGPLRLLKESRMNHLGKLAFRYMYWMLLMRGIRIPFMKPQMSLRGKKINKEA